MQKTYILTIRLTAEEIKKLRTVKNKTRLSAGEQIRRALAAWHVSEGKR